MSDFFLLFSKDYLFPLLYGVWTMGIGAELGDAAGARAPPLLHPPRIL